MTNATTDSNIKVTIVIPEKVPECLKQEKLNALYEILKPKGTEKSLQQSS